MKRSILSVGLLLCLCCFSLPKANAQFTAILDSNFGNWLLNNGYASCLSGNSVSGFLLDTTCTALSADSVECRYSNIYDLTGIQYFHNLTFLDCSDNNLTSLQPIVPVSALITTLVCNYNPLTSLPALPPSLTYLACDTDQLSALPALPAGLTFLECDSNYLTSLPALPSSLFFLFCNFNQLSAVPSLPPSLQYLDCANNRITSIPALPNTLSYLYCGKNLLTALPAISSTTLHYLYCDNNQLTSLPALPSALQFLVCNHNLLNALPALPTNVSEMDCSDNPLTSLPSLPTNLSGLFCRNNNLASLPPLPVNLYELSCDTNALTTLPVLPTRLGQLYCSYNQLVSLPPLPFNLNSLDCRHNLALSCLPRIYRQVMNWFYIGGTHITCLPNRFSALVGYTDVNTATMPLCDVTSGCDFYYNIAGDIHLDTAANCTVDSIYPYTPVTDMKVQLLQGGQVVQQFYTFTSGGYSFKTPSLSAYTISIDTAGLPLSVICPSSDSLQVSLSALDSVVTHESFGMRCSNFDYAAGYIWGHHFRPTGTTVVHIAAGNIARLRYHADCGAGISGTVTTTYSGSIRYIGPAPGARTPTSVSGTTLTYSLSDLDSLTWGSLDIIVLIDTGAVAGTSACFSTTITPITPDINPANDTLSACFTIVHSWDPNQKSVTPTELHTDGGWLTYTIDFQNTGTDTAYTVVIKDTLSSYLDASTFQYVASSHKAVIQLFGSAIAFTFPHIDLPDSAANLSQSEGWIQFRVKTKGTLPLSSQIQNTGYIYFDNNPAVVTNIATTIIGTTGLSAISSDGGGIFLYPNPNKGSFTLLTSGSINSDYTITDMLGHVIEQRTISADRQSIEMSDVADGIYTLSVKGIQSTQPLRFVVMR